MINKQEKTLTDYVKHVLCLLLLTGAVFIASGATEKANAFQIRNKANSLCLDGFQNNPNLGNGPYVYGYNCNPNNPYQQWDRVNSKYSSQYPFYLYRNRGNGLCLDAGGFNSAGNGARLYTSGCNANNDFQIWSWTGSGSGSGRLILLTSGGPKLDGANFGSNPFYPYMYQSSTTNDYQRWYLQ